MERIKPVDFYPFHETKLRVPLYEVDLGQGVYHGNYFHFFELARDEFFRALGFPYIRLMEGGMHLTVAQVVCSYYRPLGYNDDVTVKTGLEEVKTRSMKIIQQILKDSRVCTQAIFALVCVTFDGRVTRMPEEFVEKLNMWKGIG